MSISARKDYEIRTKKKKVIKAIHKAIDAITKKLDAGESPRDEDLRFLRHVFEDLRLLEESIVEETQEKDLPEGSLKAFVERAWELSKIGSIEQVIEATGYYRCSKCNELHIKGRECIYQEYQASQLMERDKEGGETE